MPQRQIAHDNVITVSPTNQQDLASPKLARTGPNAVDWKSFLARILPGLLGSLLYLMNNLDVIHGLIAPPAGYVPLGGQRNADIAQYLTWLQGLGRGWLLPNYHAAWSTPPGFTVAALIPVSILERSLSLSPILALQLFSLAGYIFGAYAVAFAYKTFCETYRQAFWSLLLAFSCVPVSSLYGVSHLLGNRSQYGEALGRIQFMIVSDGFLRGLTTWPFQTWGVGTQVLAMALLARYCDSRERRWLGWLALVCLVSALIHPF